jgi:hypothetical protein
MTLHLILFQTFSVFQFFSILYLVYGIPQSITLYLISCRLMRQSGYVRPGYHISTLIPCLLLRHDPAPWNLHRHQRSCQHGNSFDLGRNVPLRLMNQSVRGVKLYIKKLKEKQQYTNRTVEFFFKWFPTLKSVF